MRSRVSIPLILLNRNHLRQIPRSYNILFFFQAEDGIRFPLVTGVQTCALPICVFAAAGLPQPADALREFLAFYNARLLRSEERRVGKECRSRWLADY